MGSTTRTVDRGHLCGDVDIAMFKVGVYGALLRVVTLFQVIVSYGQAQWPQNVGPFSQGHGIFGNDLLTGGGWDQGQTFKRSSALSLGSPGIQTGGVPFSAGTLRQSDRKSYSRTGGRYAQRRSKRDVRNQETMLIYRGNDRRSQRTKRQAPVTDQVQAWDFHPSSLARSRIQSAVAAEMRRLVNQSREMGGSVVQKSPTEERVLPASAVSSIQSNSISGGNSNVPQASVTTRKRPPTVLKSSRSGRRRQGNNSRARLSRMSHSNKGPVPPNRRGFHSNVPTKSILNSRQRRPAINNKTVTNRRRQLQSQRQIPTAKTPIMPAFNRHSPILDASMMAQAVASLMTQAVDSHSQPSNEQVQQRQPLNNGKSFGNNEAQPVTSHAQSMTELALPMADQQRSNSGGLNNIPSNPARNTQQNTFDQASMQLNPQTGMAPLPPMRQTQDPAMGMAPLPPMRLTQGPPRRIALQPPVRQSQNPPMGMAPLSPMRLTQGPPRRIAPQPPVRQSQNPPMGMAPLPPMRLTQVPPNRQASKPPMRQNQNPSMETVPKPPASLSQGPPQGNAPQQPRNQIPNLPIGIAPQPPMRLTQDPSRGMGPQPPMRQIQDQPRGTAPQSIMHQSKKPSVGMAPQQPMHQTPNPSTGMGLQPPTHLSSNPHMGAIPQSPMRLAQNPSANQQTQQEPIYQVQSNIGINEILSPPFDSNVQLLNTPGASQMSQNIPPSKQQQQNNPKMFINQQWNEQPFNQSPLNQQQSSQHQFAENYSNQQSPVNHLVTQQNNQSFNRPPSNQQLLQTNQQFIPQSFAHQTPNQPPNNIQQSNQGPFNQPPPNHQMPNQTPTNKHPSNQGPFNRPPPSHQIPNQPPNNIQQSNQGPFNRPPPSHQTPNQPPNNIQQSNQGPFNRPPPSHQTPNQPPTNIQQSSQGPFNQPPPNHQTPNQTPTDIQQSNQGPFNRPPPNHRTQNQTPTNVQQSNQGPFNRPPPNHQTLNQPRNSIHHSNQGQFNRPLPKIQATNQRTNRQQTGQTPLRQQQNNMHHSMQQLPDQFNNLPLSQQQLNQPTMNQPRQQRRQNRQMSNQMPTNQQRTGKLARNKQNQNQRAFTQQRHNQRQKSQQQVNNRVLNQNPQRNQEFNHVINSRPNKTLRTRGPGNRNNPKPTSGQRPSPQTNKSNMNTSFLGVSVKRGLKEPLAAKKLWSPVPAGNTGIGQPVLKNKSAPQGIQQQQQSIPLKTWFKPEGLHHAIFKTTTHAPPTPPVQPRENAFRVSGRRVAMNTVKPSTTTMSPFMTQQPTAGVWWQQMGGVVVTTTTSTPRPTSQPRRKPTFRRKPYRRMGIRHPPVMTRGRQRTQNKLQTKPIHSYWKADRMNNVRSQNNMNNMLNSGFPSTTAHIPTVTPTPPMPTPPTIIPQHRPPARMPPKRRMNNRRSRNRVAAKPSFRPTPTVPPTLPTNPIPTRRIRPNIKPWPATEPPLFTSNKYTTTTSVPPPVTAPARPRNQQWRSPPRRRHPQMSHASKRRMARPKPRIVNPTAAPWATTSTFQWDRIKTTTLTHPRFRPTQKTRRNKPQRPTRPVPPLIKKFPPQQITTVPPSQNNELLQLLRQIASSSASKKTPTSTTPSPPSPQIKPVNNTQTVHTKQNNELLKLLRQMANNGAALQKPQGTPNPVQNMSNLLTGPNPSVVMTTTHPFNTGKADAGQRNMQLLLDALAHNQHKTASLNSLVMSLLHNTPQASMNMQHQFDPQIINFLNIGHGMGQEQQPSAGSMVSVLMKQNMPEPRSCICHPKLTGCPVDKKMYPGFADCSSETEVTCCDDN